MRCILFLVSGLFLQASLIALPISDKIADPYSALGSKFYSPSGVYAFWISGYRDSSGGAPIMDGPLGLLHPGFDPETEAYIQRSDDFRARPARFCSP
jgi:hypothetical protein